jgi:hypothetical protein
LTQLTMLNSMASNDFEKALDLMKDWGVTALDLKDHIFGKRVLDLTIVEAEKVASMARERGQYIYCLSTTIFQDDLEKGEEQFTLIHEKRIEQVSIVASILKPKVIRVLSAQSSKRDSFEDSINYLEKEHPWVFNLYRLTIDRFHREGFTTMIENDPTNNIFGNPEEILRFFEKINRYDNSFFTFDVQNLWAMGIFPTIEIYKQLKPIIGYLHVKGGIKDTESHKLRWQSSLEDASWPVLEMSTQAVEDDVSSVFCLNPSHGEIKPGYDYSNIVKRDLDFLKSFLFNN